VKQALRYLPIGARILFVLSQADDLVGSLTSARDVTMKFQLRQQSTHRIFFQAELFRELSLLLRTGFLKTHQQPNRLEAQITL
jgi:hypothetical protein